MGSQGFGQEVGLSFAYFFPTHGEFAAPVSPFSFRGVGIDFNSFSGVETGGSVYRMSAMSLRNLDLPNQKPLLGSSFLVMVPLDLVITLGQGPTIKFKGGVFGFASLGQKINTGNFDRALREKFGYEVANATLEIKSNPGWGYQAGAEFIIPITSTLNITLEGKYLNGSGKMPVSGSVLAVLPGGTPETYPVNYPEARLDFRGFELSLGGFITTGGPGPRARKRR